MPPLTSGPRIKLEVAEDLTTAAGQDLLPVCQSCPGPVSNARKVCPGS